MTFALMRPPRSTAAKTGVLRASCSWRVRFGDCLALPPTHVSSASTSPSSMPTSSAIKLVADQVAHAPCGLVGDAQLALDVLGGDPASCAGHQVDHVEPQVQRRGRLVEDR